VAAEACTLQINHHARNRVSSLTPLLRKYGFGRVFAAKWSLPELCFQEKRVR